MNIEIADRLQKLRKEKGYSQESLADALGISRQAVSKWERAESSPDTDNLILLARLYNMSLDDLLNTNDSTEEIKQANLDNASNNKKEEGIEITDDEGQTLKIKDGHIEAYDKDGNLVKPNKKRLIVKSITDAVWLSIALIVFFVVGFTVKDGFTYSWIAFVMMIPLMSITDCIYKKKLSEFVYPVFVAAIYLFLGMVFSLWHPMWVLFITIPLFYAIVNPIDRYVFKTLDDDKKKAEEKEE